MVRRGRGPGGTIRREVRPAPGRGISLGYRHPGDQLKGADRAGRSGSFLVRPTPSNLRGPVEDRQARASEVPPPPDPSLSSPTTSDAGSRGPWGRWGPRLAYLFLILLVTVPPPAWEASPELLAERLRAAFDLSFRGRDVIDAVRNLLLFAGWGTVWAATATAPAGNTRRDVRTVGMATLLGGLISLGVETLQLFSPRRDTNVWDLFTNVTGALAGAVVLVLLVRLLACRRGAPSYLGLPALVPAFAYGGAVLLEALFPLLEPGVVPGLGGGILDRGRGAVEAFSWDSLGQLPLHHLPLFLPAGTFAVMALVEGGTAVRRAAVLVSGLAWPLFLLVELLGGIAGHPIVAGAVLLHGLAVGGGALLAFKGLAPFSVRFRGRIRPLLLGAAYLLLLAMWSWRPFTLITSPGALVGGLSLEQLVPLHAHAQRFDLFSATDILRHFLLLFPVGVLLAVWPLRSAGWGNGPLPGVAVALFLEGGQILVEGRMFDMTDALVGSAAVLVGWTVARQARFPVRGTLVPPPRLPLP